MKTAIEIFLVCLAIGWLALGGYPPENAIRDVLGVYVIVKLTIIGFTWRCYHE